MTAIFTIERTLVSTLTRELRTRSVLSAHA
jgi:hypothetical protein